MSRCTEFLRRLGKWFSARLEEKSTYTGFAIAGIAIGHHIPQEIYDAIAWWGPFVATGLVTASTKEPIPSSPSSSAPSESSPQ